MNFLRKFRKPLEQKWLISFEGKELGILTDCQNLEMFWDTYLVNPNSKGSEKVLRTKKLWEECVFSFTHFSTKQVVSAFCGGDYINYCLNKQDRISMRGLYLQK